ncbi:hypothetical protein [Stygiobacter electus]|uniref:Uncharacterized protein n=1 Tax=Stygiobacter electus TaxID=3032292 RepID=A0AAE3TBL4_9BACT|nr:hypothetical protein [Stygiobacter electus]MDF1610935.1 hypothetical protein [Stygiobacter electus]
MKRFSIFFVSIYFLFSFSIKSQNSIQLVTIGNLSSIDIGSIILSNSLEGQSRFFQLIMITQPIGRKVYLIGRLDWKPDLNSSFNNLANFKTNIFNARNIFSDELGNSDIKLDNINGDKEYFKQIFELNKPKGIFGISIQMFSENGEFLDDDYQEITFLNPTQTFSITQPNYNEEVDIGNVICSWSSVAGATSYKIKACVLENESQSLEEALNSTNPIINNYDVGLGTLVNLSDVPKSREWYGGQKIVVVVYAIVNESGSISELKSEPVVFKLKSFNNPPDINLVRFANIFSSIIPDELLKKITNGSLQLDQIDIKDENGNKISLDELNKILNMLEANPNLIINYSFKQK